jgi:hypothetical protein
MQNTQEKAQYDFPVELVPVYTFDEKLQSGHDHGFLQADGRKAVRREDNLKVLGVVSDKYRILPHAQVVEGFRSALEGNGNITETIKVTKGGARLYLNYTFPDVSLEVRPGDNVNLQLIAVNSYDGSHVLQVMFGAFRLVCSNGLIIGSRFVNLEQRHVGAIGIKVDSLQMQVGMLTEKFRATLPVMKEMAATPIPDEQRVAIFDPEKVKLPDYLLRAADVEYALEANRSRGTSLTKWGYYNAMTFAITHKMRRESPEAQIRYGRVAWEAAQALV